MAIRDRITPTLVRVPQAVAFGFCPSNVDAPSARDAPSPISPKMLNRRRLKETSGLMARLSVACQMTPIDEG